MPKPKYSNMFVAAVDTSSGDITITFYNEWLEFHDPRTDLDNNTRKLDTVATLVLSRANAQNLIESIDRSMKNFEEAMIETKEKE